MRALIVSRLSSSVNSVKSLSHFSAVWFISSLRPSVIGNLRSETIWVILGEARRKVNWLHFILFVSEI